MPSSWFTDLVSRDRCVALPYGAMGLPAVCNCFFFLSILTYYFRYYTFTKANNKDDVQTARMCLSSAHLLSFYA